MAEFLLAIDQGTTSTRAIVFNHHAVPISQQQIEFKQYFPQLGWVEHDVEEIWQATLSCCQQAVAKAKINFADIAAIGITNQRETSVIWDRTTGKPIYNAIVWQDRRTVEICQQLKSAGYEDKIRDKTGLLLDPYFSASKIAWLLTQLPEARQLAEQGKLAFGTMDCFLLWRLTNGKSHATDVTNASRTLLYNIHTLDWDDELLDIFKVPKSLLPQVFDNTHLFGKTEAKLFGKEIPITGMAGDQQAALIGQTCFTPGMIKSTYGTGAFLMLNTGEKAVVSQQRLLTTIGYRLENKTTYALEGSIFSAGSIVQWLRDKLQLIHHASQTEALAASVADNGGVYLIPAFTGLGAPYWAPEARAAIFGLTRNSEKAHIIRAGLEAVVYQTRDLIAAMIAEGIQLNALRVDGGMVANNWLLQFLADMLEVTVYRPQIIETTVLGAAYLAGLGLGMFKSVTELSKLWQFERKFVPMMSSQNCQMLYQGWQQAMANIIDNKY